MIWLTYTDKSTYIISIQPKKLVEIITTNNLFQNHKNDVVAVISAVGPVLSSGHINGSFESKLLSSTACDLLFDLLSAFWISVSV